MYSSPRHCGLQVLPLSVFSGDETEAQSGQVPCPRSHSSTGKGRFKEGQDEGRALASPRLSVLACERGERMWGWLGVRVHHGRDPRSSPGCSEEPVRSCLAWGLQTSCWVFVINNFCRKIISDKLFNRMLTEIDTSSETFICDAHVYQVRGQGVGFPVFFSFLFISLGFL